MGVRGVFGRRKAGGGRGEKGREGQRLQSELCAPGLGCLAALPFPENRDHWFWPGKPHSPRRGLTAFTFELTLSFHQLRSEPQLVHTSDKCNRFLCMSSVGWKAL